MVIHKKYMQRCLHLAKNGIGTARPNPSVGAVIVCGGKIIGEGFTSEYGENHAEVNAINAVEDKTLLKEATMYVTLEPCSHFGKTPPCADLIVRNQIQNVVIGCVDSNSLVAGKGIERLQNAGCTVTVGVLEEACRAHHKRFFTVQDSKRPFIILKWAETSNGYMAPSVKSTVRPVWISNVYSQQLVHKWRSEEHAILVGTNTVIADNPKLNVRSWGGRNPTRIVLDRNARVSLNAHVFDKKIKTIVLTEEKSKQTSENLVFEELDFTNNVVGQICDVLQKHQIQSVIVEGGLQTLQAFIDAKVWDEARIFIGDNQFMHGVEAPKIQGTFIKEIKIKEDFLKIMRND